MKQAILDFLKDEGQPVTFAQLSRRLPGFSGDKELVIGQFRNLVAWRYVSTEFVCAFEELQRESKIKIDPCPEHIYIIDGIRPPGPASYEERHHSTLHWLPVVIKLAE